MSNLPLVLLAFLGIVLILIGVTISKQIVKRRQRSSSVNEAVGQGGFGKDLSDG